MYKTEFCIRYRTLGATTLERITDVTQLNIKENRNTTKEGQGKGKQQRKMGFTPPGALRTFVKLNKSSSISVGKGWQRNLNI